MPDPNEHDGTIVIMFALAGMALVVGLIGYVFARLVCGA